jgi:hypothetical protein
MVDARSRSGASDGSRTPDHFEIPTPADRWTRAAASRGTLASKIAP